MSSKPKVFVQRNDFPCDSVDRLREKFDVICPVKNDISKKEFIDLARGSFAIFCYHTDSIPIDKEVIDGAGPNLKVIATCSVGYDHLDVKEIRRRGIRIGHTPGVLTEAVAEMALTLLLSLSRRVVEATAAVKSGAWGTSWTPEWMCGMGLAGSTVGIVGLGRIGFSVAEKLKQFKVARILYTSREETKAAAGAFGGTLVDVDRLIAESDFVVVTVALTPETKHIINRERISKMKKNAIIVNVARGGLVDQDALREALKAKKIAGASLDVTVPEPLPVDSPLLKLDNVIITPHIASATYQARTGMANLTVDNIIAVLEGTKMPAELVD